MQGEPVPRSPTEEPYESKRSRTDLWGGPAKAGPYPDKRRRRSLISDAYGSTTTRSSRTLAGTSKPAAGSTVITVLPTAIGSIS